jgi:pimeloyl-ACP methyl ester carboxylesterase
MAGFVFVHGGFSGAWIWLPLMDRLKAAGHVVEAFDLPGMGDDHTSASEVSLDSYAGRVCEALATSSEPAIVVGHSMGGIVATQAAAHCPARVAALVYVAAFLPKDGQSLLDLTKLPECDGEQVLANVVVEGESPVAVMPPAASRLALYGSCAEDVAAWAIARQCPQPVSPLSNPVSIPPGAINGINRYYVLCTRDRAIPPPLQRRMVAENPCADVIELDTDHTPQLSMTNELAKALHQFATHSSASTAKKRESVPPYHSL